LAACRTRRASGNAGDRGNVTLSIATAARNLAALRNGLRDLGYTEGKNIKIEYRFGDGNPERFTQLLSELVGLKPAAIVVGSNAAVMAAVKATQT
jgi:putative ABC transport system substrate-binding protein